MSRPRTHLPTAAALLLAVALGAAATHAAGEVTATYVANEGVLLAGGGAKILIDALVDDGVAGYPTPPPEIQAKLEAAEPPFDRVDLVLATHFHGDHFGPRAVARHLAANPRARFVSTPQAVERLRQLLGESSSILARVRGVYPAEGRRETVEHPGAAVTVLNLHHGRDRRPPVENLGFLIELGGVRLLHVGDTMATADELAAAGLAGEQVDAAFLPDWFVLYERWRPAVQETIRPRQVIAFHLPSRDAPAGYFAGPGTFEGHVRQIQTSFPGAAVLERPMSVLTLSRGE